MNYSTGSSIRVTCCSPSLYVSQRQPTIYSFARAVLESLKSDALRICVAATARDCSDISVSLYCLRSHVRQVRRSQLDRSLVLNSASSMSAELLQVPRTTGVNLMSSGSGPDCGVNNEAMDYAELPSAPRVCTFGSIPEYWGCGRYVPGRLTDDDRSPRIAGNRCCHQAPTQAEREDSTW